MTIDDIVTFVTGLGGVVAQTPSEGDGSPELAWGDTFFYYSPDGTIPAAQPVATIVTKTYPGEEQSRLDRPGAFRVNIAAGRELFTEYVGVAPRELTAGTGEAPDDTVVPHPTYGSLGWLAVVNPGPNSEKDVHRLLRHAWLAACGRFERRQESSDGSS
ncbi:DUF6194 family protein [Mycetocola zhadangensis]|uniref:DUF6194 domain-containing protein n=1 Tax=Mycetocola zhadangensis TaxID=1164595 RepID=A0A3L7ISB6_9MICO|nr:DUF6194 family protein [Mycetocola zhadangensis]RLQ81106.1 hypothetical protein D9V28_15310 [Mycetocola zhadangensis]GGF04829.1 hypothetical protein GCM10011313_29940 [Mycetocola zhadangensis]